MHNKSKKSKYVLTVTLNPVMDHFHTFSMSNSMGKLKRSVLSIGGKGINVSRAFKELNIDSLATGIMGEVNDVHLDRQIKTDFYRIKQETRASVTLCSTKKNELRVFTRDPSISDSDKKLFITKYKQLLRKSQLVLFSGRRLDGFDANIYARLIRMAHEQGVPTFLDSSGDELKEGLKASPTYIKPNEEEVKQLFGIQLNTLSQMKLAVKRFRRLHIKNVFISLGSKGAMGCNDNDLWYAKAPKVKVLHTVGCGDAFVAGVCKAILQEKNMQQCLELGISTATSCAMNIIPGQINALNISKFKNNIQFQNWRI